MPHRCWVSVLLEVQEGLKDQIRQQVASVMQLCTVAKLHRAMMIDMLVKVNLDGLVGGKRGLCGSGASRPCSNHSKHHCDEQEHQSRGCDTGMCN